MKEVGREQSTLYDPHIHLKVRFIDTAFHTSATNLIILNLYVRMM